MAGRLPRPILRRSKVGFDIPAHEWLRGPLRPLLEDTLDSAASEWPELFDWTRIQSYRNDHFSRRSNYGYHLWGLMILCLWMRRWEIQVGPALDAPAHAHVPVKVAIQR
jgi:asparagine synthase (glutamine-hydrolysing)